MYTSQGTIFVGKTNFQITCYNCSNNYSENFFSVLEFTEFIRSENWKFIHEQWLCEKCSRRISKDG